MWLRENGERGTAKKTDKSNVEQNRGRDKREFENKDEGGVK